MGGSVCLASQARARSRFGRISPRRQVAAQPMRSERSLQVPRISDGNWSCSSRESMTPLSCQPEMIRSRRARTWSIMYLASKGRIFSTLLRL